jgi:hypothetical protein
MKNNNVVDVGYPSEILLTIIIIMIGGAISALAGWYTAMLFLGLFGMA